MEKRTTYQVHSISLCLWILKHGIFFYGTKQREEDPSKTVFFFPDTEEVRNLVREYQENKRG